MGGRRARAAATHGPTLGAWAEACKQACLDKPPAAMATAEECLQDIQGVVDQYTKILNKIKKKGAFPKKPAEREAVSGPHS